MIVTLAGPGAGKTTNLIKQIIAVIPELKANREAAVITYTNASADDLKRKLKREIDIPHNLFIGTIHSFLFRYYIQPFAHEKGYRTSNTVIVEKLSDEGVDWIDKWATENIPDIVQRKIIINGKKGSIRNKQIEAAAKKGIYTYDAIVKISKTLSEDSNISKAISNRLQFLFVDEYQDIDKYGHNIVMNLFKRKKTEIFLVGDPDQSIYRFRYDQSQIGELAPKDGKQPLREMIALCEHDKAEKRELLINHRSSKEIVDFANRYGTLTNQTAEKGNLCPVMMITDALPDDIYRKFIDIGKKYDCKSYYILAKKNKTLEKYLKLTFETNTPRIKEYDLKQIIDFFVAASGLSRREFIETYEFSRLQLRRIAVGTRTALEKKDISFTDSARLCKELARDLYGKNITFKRDIVLDEKGKKIVYGFKSSDENDEMIKDDCIRCLSIHKSKGLEADAVLVIAQNEKEFLKWLNMTKNGMKSDTDEDFRLGYVAFTRARKVLLIACADKVDISKINNSVNIETDYCLK